MCWSYNKTYIHNDADCRARPVNILNGNPHFFPIRLPSVPGSCSSCDLPVRDDSDKKSCLSFLVREVQPSAKSTEARVKEEKGARTSALVPTAATEGWRTCHWLYTLRAEPAISSGGPVAEEKLNLCYTFEEANDAEPVEMALMASSLVAVLFENIVKSNLAPYMADSEASGHYFNDAIIHDLKHRLQDYVHFPTSRKILTAGGAMLNSTAEGVL